MKIEFTVLGKPAHQQRHRHFRRENFSGTYDPSKEDKKDFLWVAMSNKPKKPILTPITLNVEFYFPRPKSHYRSGKYSDQLKDSSPIWHINKPDIDNLSKFIMDSLNKTFWKDDSSICILIASKRYSETPRTEIKISSEMIDIELEFKNTLFDDLP